MSDATRFHLRSFLVAGAVLAAGAALAAAWPDEGATRPEIRGAAASTALPALPRIHGVVCVGMTVADLDRSLAFYREVLGFEPVAGPVETAGDGVERLSGVFGSRTRTARLRLGAEFLELTEFLAPEGRPFPADSRSNDLWFQHVALVTGDMAKAYAHLRSHRVRHASAGPQRLPDWNPAAGGIEAFYFRDPDGHFLEAISFPEGKGDPRWRTATDRLFLGIDHTAIVVADTDRSVAFYGKTLGLRVAGASENHGIEQERLNNVFGARLRITALRGDAGPGLELLEYLAPSGGRPYPEGSRAADLLHWETTFVVADADSAAHAARPLGSSWISPGAVDVPGAPLGFERASLVRDPDGHALRLVEPRP